MDDIIFGSSNESLCKEFAKIMQGEFELSIRLQIKHTKYDICQNQEK